MTKHAATDKTPFEVLFGQQPRLEFDAKWGTEAKSESTREETLTEVKGGVNAAAGRMKKDYDKRFKAKSARVLDGRRVYWKVPVRKTKLGPTVKRPFRAERTDSRLCARSKGAGRATKGVHGVQRTPCYNADGPVDTLRDRGRPRANEGGVAVASQQRVR